MMVSNQTESDLSMPYDFFEQPVINSPYCRRDVPTGVREFPLQPIAVECPLCGELRRYLPTEVFLGRPDQLVVRQQRVGGR